MFFTDRCCIHNKYILSIVHMDYMRSIGGVEKLVCEHSKLFQSNCISYVVLCPMRHVESDVYKLYIDDVYCGSFTIKKLIGLFAGWESFLIGCHVHHVMGWRYTDLLFLFKTLETKYIFYIHDYYLICNQYVLLDSNKEFCGSKLPSYDKCRNCFYYTGSDERNEEISELLRLTSRKGQCFVAPSEYVREIWTEAYPKYQKNTFVIEHLNLSGEKILEKRNNSKIRVAYIGAPVNIKGWPMYEKLIHKFKDDERYEFYHLGMVKVEQNSVINIPVSFQEDGEDAMIKAIQKHQIDCATFFSQCPETYNYTCYEAYLGGAFLITIPKSGNIQAMVQKHNCGRIFESEFEIYDFFKGDGCSSAIMQYRNSDSKIPKLKETNRRILEYVDLNEKGKFICAPKHFIVENWKGIAYDIKHFFVDNR